MFQARDNFHAQIAASHSQQIQSTDLLDDGDVMADDRDLDVDLTGEYLLRSLCMRSISDIIEVYHFLFLLKYPLVSV